MLLKPLLDFTGYRQPNATEGIVNPLEVVYYLKYLLLHRLCGVSKALLT